MLTACGIETLQARYRLRSVGQLQQCLPLAVLKPKRTLFSCWWQNKLQQCLPLAVLKLGGTTKFFRCGLLYSCNSAYRLRYWNVIIDIRVSIGIKSVATVLTACGIETKHFPYGFSRQFDLVATVLTACGIETLYILDVSLKDFLLQQCLPLAVLKRSNTSRRERRVVTSCNSAYRLRYWNILSHFFQRRNVSVATVLTACGIETWVYPNWSFNTNMLQQCLPLAVLKPSGYSEWIFWRYIKLQQCLPLAVLKPKCVGNVLEVIIMLQQCLPLAVLKRS